MPQSPKEQREKLRQEEVKRPASAVQGSVLSDLAGSLGWKGTLSLIALLAVGFIVYTLFFS